MKEIFGFDTVKQSILNDFKNNHLHHCTLLYSEEGTGKFTFAKQISAIILSETANLSPNQITDKDIEATFNLIENGAHSDLIILNYETLLDEKKKETKVKNEISVDQVRELILKMQLTPLLSKNKVVIIDSIDATNMEAQNALLKTLEEPTKSTYIFLICHNKNKVLQTIISRSNVINVPMFSMENWVKALLENITAEESENLTEEQLEKLYIISNKSVRSAIDILENNGMDLYERMLDLFTTKNVLEIQKFANEIDKDKSKVLFSIFAKLLKTLFNDLINYSLGLEKNSFIEKNEQLFKQLSQKNNINNIVLSYESVQKILRDLDIYNLSKVHCITVIFTNYL